MKSVLILTYYYKHKNAMASIRGIKLAKFLSRYGYDVTVMTSNQIDTWTKDYTTPEVDRKIKEIYAPQHWKWSIIQKFLSLRQSTISAREQQKTEITHIHDASKKQIGISIKEKLSDFLHWVYYFNLAKQEDICLFKGLKLEYTRQGKKQYDCCIATYPVYGVFLMAIWLKKHGHCDKFIADFRDPLYNPGFRDKKIEAEYDKRCLKKVLDYADEVVCVTKGISDGIQKIFPKYDKQQIKVLTNGFDRDDLSNDTVVEPFDVRVNFVYTGTLYHGKRCVNMLACVLKELIESSTICKNDFRFQYAGPDFEELLSQLSEYDLEDTAVDHGFVSRDESIALQKQASALLLLTWNEVSYQGVVPGKLYEYMAIGDVPIIGLITGDVCNSEAASIINDTSMGCVAEAANWEKDKDKLRSFTKNLFSDKGTVLGNPNKYSYQVIAKEYSEIIRGKNKND